MFFCALAVYLHGNKSWKKKQLKMLIILKRVDGLRPTQFHGVHMNDNPDVDHLLLLNFLHFDIDISGGGTL